MTGWDQGSLSRAEEKRLLKRARRGDHGAFEKIVVTFRERAMAGAISLLQNQEDARDLTQEAFVRAFKALKSYDPERPFYPWYYRILRNLCMTHLKKFGPSRRVSLDAMIEDHHVQFESSDEDVRDRLQRDQMSRYLGQAIEKLKPEFKEIIAMKHFEEMSYEEISQALKIPMGTVMSRLFHARKALAKLMEKYRH